MTCDEKNVCLDPDRKRLPIIPYDKSILWVTSRIAILSLEISGFSVVLLSKFLVEKIKIMSYTIMRHIYSQKNKWQLVKILLVFFFFFDKREFLNWVAWFKLLDPYRTPTGRLDLLYTFRYSDKNTLLGVFVSAVTFYSPDYSYLI